ncbi:MAG: methyltransferase MtaB domain-containing protein [Ignavibacteria bacterium]
MKLEIEEPSKLIFGKAPKPVKCKRGFSIGSGEVYPEINFTLPQMIIDDSTWNEIKSMYSDLINEICRRAVDLKTPALVVEFELLPPMTVKPEWGAEITSIIAKSLEEHFQKYGLKSALRATPVDVRDSERPPLMRNGEMTEKMFHSFGLCADAGADMLSIESTGGKEVHDEALLNGDLAGIVFALGVLAVKDMGFLWNKIVEISSRKNLIAAGDTACGFANTAMILADKGMLPKTLAAVDRSATIVRSLQAYIEGAVGPSKDCAYEGPFIKAMTGIPISMEGKTSACAHLSSLGNIAAACADLWSNESVQNVKLLSTFAPVVSLEQLIYDCRLMNQSLKEGIDSALKYRKWMVEGDAYLDPQAYVLKPDVVIRICKKIIEYKTPYEMTLGAVDETLKILREASGIGEIKLTNIETRWLNMLSAQFDGIPGTEEAAFEMIRSGIYEGKFIPAEYEFT